jgi:hypothetical protein
MLCLPLETSGWRLQARQWLRYPVRTPRSPDTSILRGYPTYEATTSTCASLTLVRAIHTRSITRGVQQSFRCRTVSIRTQPQIVWASKQASQQAPCKQASSSSAALAQLWTPLAVIRNSAKWFGSSPPGAHSIAFSGWLKWCAGPGARGRGCAAVSGEVTRLQAPDAVDDEAWWVVRRAL